MDIELIGVKFALFGDVVVDFDGLNVGVQTNCVNRPTPPRDLQLNRDAHYLEHIHALLVRLLLRGEPVPFTKSSLLK